MNPNFRSASALASLLCMAAAGARLMPLTTSLAEPPLTSSRKGHSRNLGAVSDFAATKKAKKAAHRSRMAQRMARK